MRLGQPEKFWKAVKTALRWWETTGSPPRWPLWRTFFWGREGVYVVLRGVGLASCLAVVTWSSWVTRDGCVLRFVAIAVAVFLVLDIILVHTSIAFVTRGLTDQLRTAFLTMCSFFQIPLAFSVFQLCIADSFSTSTSTALTWWTAVYFSVVTATTLGYGDIHPKTSGAQALAVAEVVVSLAFLAIVVATLINLPTAPGETGPGGRKAQDRRLDPSVDRR